MAELENRTPFAAHYVLLPDEQGVDTLFVNIKATFDLRREWTLADFQWEPLYEDAYWGETGASALKLPADVHQGKPSTDIAVLASACAPENKPVRVLDVTASIGPYKKTLRVFGDRHWHGDRITSPAEFSTLPIRYEHAFGGSYKIDEQLIDMEERNPLGKGFRGTRPAHEMEGQPLPNIEDPRHLIRHINDTPEPAGFGFIAPNWSQRARYAGTYDTHWQHNRAPYLPLDYQARFQNAAHPDLISQNYLKGGEQVELTNLHPSGPLSFFLPRIVLGGHAHFTRQPKRSLQFMLETVVIDVDAMQLCMGWKATCLCNNAFPSLSAINVHLANASI